MKSGSNRRYGVASFVFVLGAVLSGLAAHQAYLAGERDETEAFQRRSHRAHLIATERFARFETLLHGGRGLWIASDSVEPREWSQFLSGFHMGGGLNAVRSFGFAATDATGEHAPVRLIEPRGQNSSLLSRDFAAIPALRREMEASLEDGVLRVVETGALSRLGAEGDLLLLLPVFSADRPAETPEARRGGLIGWVFLTLDLNAALTGIADGARIDMRVGIEAKGEPRWLQPPLSEASFRPETEPQRLASCGGRILALYGSEPQAPEVIAAKSAGIGFVGLVLTLSISGLVYMLVNTRQKATVLAERITEKLRKEQREIAKLASIAEQTHSPVLFIDTEGEVEWANAAFKALLARDERGLPFTPVFDRETEIGDRTVVLTGTPVVAAEGNVLGTVVVATDLTDRVQRERALESARQEAEQTSRLKSEFLANMSHEIRTPMNGVIGMAQVLLESPLDVEQRDTAQTLLLSAQSLHGILNDVLDLSKIESGRLALAQDRFDVREVLEEIAAPFAAAAARKGIEFVLDVDLPIRTFATGDLLRIRQAVGNLLSNAVKFTDRGHVTLEAVIGDGIGITVSDTGVGIPGACHAWVFEPFRQADGSTTRQFGGTGLGLAIVKSITEAMDGSIALQSRPGMGTTLSLWLPLPTEFEAANLHLPAVDLPSPLGPHSAAVRRLLAWQKIPVAPGATPLVPVYQDACVVAWALGDARLSHPLRAKDMDEVLTQSKRTSRPDVPSGPTARVLVVDDNDVNRKVAAKLLQRHGCAVDLAFDGDQALTALESAAYDLVLMDLQMPVLDGLEATREWRRREDVEARDRVRIVALTARAMPGDEQECYQAGMDGYLTKPIMPDRLAQLLTGCGVAVVARPG
ncbi:MAG: ATP-binding protein [Fimbriimonas sp.]